MLLAAHLLAARLTQTSAFFRSCPLHSPEDTRIARRGATGGQSHERVSVPKKELSAALRDARVRRWTLSPDCAALHPGLFSHLPSGKNAVDLPAWLLLAYGKNAVDPTERARIFLGKTAVHRPERPLTPMDKHCELHFAQEARRLQGPVPERQAGLRSRRNAF
jgi:hypothetical protein